VKYMDNKGWGYTTMIILLVLLALIGIVAIIYIYKLYTSIGG